MTPPPSPFLSLGSLLNRSGSYSRTATVTADVLKEYQELIENTKSDLEDHLRDIDSKLTALSRSAATVPNVAASDREVIQEERQSTQQCLEICATVAAHIEAAQTKIFANVNTPAHTMS